MATDFVVTANNNQQKFYDVSFVGQAKTYSIDFSPWAEDNNNISSVAWSTNGSATISGEALTSNVATALVTTASAGRSIIKVIATTSTEKYVVYIDLLVKDLENNTSDYGLC